MNKFDFSVVEPRLNEWLPAQINIDGYGIAEFQEPKGILKGPISARIDETGSYSLEMAVEEIETENVLQLGIHELLSADKPKLEGNQLILVYPYKNNTCVKLSVFTDEGKFVAEEFDFFLLNQKFSKEEKVEFTVVFSPPRFQFFSNNHKPAFYWAMPLLNFVSDFSPPEPRLANHALRIFLDGIVPGNIPEDKKEQAKIIAQSKNRLLVFEFLDELAFIEGLPDYEERVNKLMDRISPTILTSVMVGIVGDNSSDYSNYEQWFPFILLDLLSFITGIKVGTPWIEFRDKEGGLVARYHGRFYRPYFVKGARIIDEGLNRGTGNLLSTALQSSTISDSYLRTAMLLTTKGGSYQQSIEDKMTFLCRAFETLCAHFGHRTQNLLYILDDSNRIVVQEILSESSLSIKELIDNSTDNPNQKKALNRIWGKITNAASIDKQFGSAVSDLLKEFGLPDAEILDRYFLSHPFLGNITSWEALLSMFRGTVIHNGYFDFHNSEYGIDDVWIVIQHLHDLLARIILKLLNYDGTYQPTVYKVTSVQPIDWVKSNTLPGLLGYAEGQVKFELARISVKLSDEKSD